MPGWRGSLETTAWTFGGARLSFQRQKAEEWRNCRCPFRHSPPFPSSLDAARALGCSQQFPAPPPGRAPPVLGFWCSQPSQAPQSRCCGMSGVPAAPGGSGLTLITVSARGSSAHFHAQLPGMIPRDFLLSLLEFCLVHGAFGFPVPQIPPGSPGCQPWARECCRD